MALGEELAHANAGVDARKAKRNMALTSIAGLLGRKRKLQEDGSALAAAVCKAARVVQFCLAPVLRPQDEPLQPPLLELC